MTKRVGGYKWVRFKKGVLEKRGCRCEVCGRYTEKLILDHIHTLYFGGKEFDESNVQLLCGDCDKKKTKRDLSLVGWFRMFDLGL